MIDNPFGTKKLFGKTTEVKEPVVVPLDTKVPESLVPIPEESEHAKILREHGYLESNIPIRHHYWKIRP